MNFPMPNLNGMNPAPMTLGVRRWYVAKLLVQKSGTYNDQWRRPMVSTGAGNVVNQLENILHKNANLNPVAMAGPAFQLLQPQPTPEGNAPVVIDNGWETQRLRFLLHVVAEDMMGTALNYYYSGYTSFSDLSYGNNIDPNMVFTINSAQSTKAMNHRAATGMQTLQLPLGAAQILAPTSSPEIANPNKLYSLTPETVVDDIMTEDLKHVQGSTFINSSSYINAPVRSSRNNNVAPDYMAKLIGGYRAALMGNPDDSRDSQLEHVKQVMHGYSETEDKFLSWLAQRRIQTAGSMGNLTFLRDNQFTVSDLLTLDSSCAPRCKPVENPTIGNNQHSRGGTEFWHKSSVEAQYASLLAQALPSYMAQYQLTKLSLTSNNEMVNGQIVTLFNKVNSYNNHQNMATVLEVLKTRLDTELFMALSYQNTMQYRVEVHCDLNGETWVIISLGGGVETPFCCPTFCDSLFSSVATTQQSTLDALSKDFSQLFGVVDQHVAEVNSARHGGQPILSLGSAPMIGGAVGSPMIGTPTIGVPIIGAPAVAPVGVPSIGTPTIGTGGGNTGSNNPGF